MPKRRRLMGDQVVRARRLRRGQPVVEQISWEMARGRQLGFEFRRQHPVMGFVLDFYCHEAALAIEFDGEQHDAAWDARRDAALRDFGIETLRIPNLAVFLLDGAAFPRQWLEEILCACEERTGRKVDR